MKKPILISLFIILLSSCSNGDAPEPKKPSKRIMKKDTLVKEKSTEIYLPNNSTTLDNPCGNCDSVD